MKTNQILVRENEAFVQRTKDGYFNATVLINKWNDENPKHRKAVAKFSSNQSTIEFIDQLKKEGIIDPIVSTRQKGTWMHPKLFIDFAMWVSVEFKSVVIDYVLDGLIKSRHDAGDYYNEMCASILSSFVDFYGRKPNPIIYISEAKRIKSILGLNDKPRNEMSEDELSSITHLQKLNALLIKKKVGNASRDKQLKIHAEMLNM